MPSLWRLLHKRLSNLVPTEKRRKYDRFCQVSEYIYKKQNISLSCIKKVQDLKIKHFYSFSGKKYFQATIARA
jgi:hypothetical protein